MKEKKKGKITLSLLHRRKEFFFYIYEVFVKQKKRKRSANHYSAGSYTYVLFDTGLSATGDTVPKEQAFCLLSSGRV